MTRQNFPRSAKALLGGMAHLGRFIDKIRLRHAGQIQDYDYITVGFDKYLVDFLGIDSNDAGVPHLGGWGCEQGAVCCSPGAMMAVDETPSTGARGVQDSVPFGMGDAVPAKNPRARSS